MQLHDQVARITARLQERLSQAPKTGAATHAAEAVPPVVARQKVDKMSAEVVDSNPYSRLMALQRMGIVKDYERIRHKTV